MTEASSYLHGGDVSVAHVSVHVLDLGEVLLRHLDQLRPSGLLRQLGGALVLGGRVLILMPVLLETGNGAGQDESPPHTQGTRKFSRSKEDEQRR